nr:MAG TPA: hypothetical protein [Caudoviricetes sp.]
MKTPRHREGFFIYVACGNDVCLRQAMMRCFCLSAKAMCLRRDACLRHVADYT